MEESVSPAQPITQPPTQSQPVISSPEKKSGSKKLLLFGLLGIVVLLLVVGVYVLGNQQTKQLALLTNTISPTMSVLTPTVDPTANWKMYTASNNTYTFQYPNNSDWTISSQSSPLGGIISSVKCTICTGDNVYLFQIAPVTTTSVDDYIAHPIGTSDFTQFTLNGDPAVRAAYAGSPQSGGSSVHVFVVHNGKGYEISYWYDGLLNASELVQYPTPHPDIFSTFKFTDQASAGDTSGWRTYIDPLYHFVLKYPPTWIQEQASRSTQVEMGVQPYSVGYRIDNPNDPKQASLFVSVSIYENPSKQNLQSWFTQLNKVHSNELHVLDQLTTIGGRTSIHARQQPEFENDFVNYVSTDGKVNLIYNFDFGGDGEGGGNYADNDPFVQTERENFTAFLSSFAFAK